MSVMRQFELIMHRALVTELGLVGFVVVIVAVMLAPEARRRLCETAVRMGAARLRRVRHAAEAADLARYAEEIAVAAQRAEVTAERRHHEWVAAQHRRDAAWQAYEGADAAARRAREAAAYPPPESGGTPEDLAANGRFLRRAVTEAYQRAELSADQVADALSHRNGWDPGRHRCELEVLLRRAVWQRLLAAYRTAAQMERAAWHAADTAAAGRRCLADEAFAVAQRVGRSGVRAGGRVAVPAPRQRPALLAQESTVALARQRTTDSVSAAEAL
jgi:hypothetical protein